MATTNYTQLHKAKRTIKLSIAIMMITLSGLALLVLVQRNSNNPATSQASNNSLPQASTNSTVTRVTAVNTSGNDQLTGLNSRADSCSTEVKGVLDWGATGILVESEGKVDTCVGRTLTWYHVKWDNGVQGWTAGDFLKFETLDQQNTDNQ